MSSKIVKGSNLNIKNISFLDYENKWGNTSVSLKYNDQKFSIQTPKMSLPWNLSCYQNSKSETYKMTLSFKGMENNPELEEFYNNLLEFDQLILDTVKENKEKWFDEEYSDEELDKLYTPIIRHSTDKETGEIDGKYPSTIGIKIPFSMNKFKIKIYDENKEPINLESVPLPSIIIKEKELKTIFDVNNLWFINGKFGCTLSCVQIRMFANEITNLAFLNNNDDISDDEFDVSSDDE